MSGTELIILKEAITATGSSDPVQLNSDQFSVQASGFTTAGAGAATVVVEVSNVPSPTVDGDWVAAGTISLTLATTKSADAVAIAVPYKRARVRVSAISGTGASVSAYLCQG